jgi:hypothetical protein
VITVFPRLYTNLSGVESVRKAFDLFSAQPCDVFLACPFFSNDQLVSELIGRQCRVRLIVRLGPATDALALSLLQQQTGVQIRFYTSQRFHAKLYIFGQHAALVGSANLTDAGLVSNGELAVVIGPEDDRFDSLLGIFQQFWEQAEVLTPERCKEYVALQARYGPTQLNTFETEVRKRFGDSAPQGIRSGGSKSTKEKTFLKSYRQVYDEFLDAFRFVEQRYKETGQRQQPEEIVPLRIEIDQFFSFVRERFTTGDSYAAAPIRHGRDVEQFVDEHLAKWFVQRWQYLDDVIAKHYQQINSVLGSAEQIQHSSAEEIFDALDVCHSIHDRLRFFPGGHDKLRQTFLAENALSQLHKVIVYLLHGHGNYVERMANCIYDSKYQLRQFGRAAVQELFGWVNRDNIPICNGRTVKALRYLGFNVVVFN